MTTLATRRRTAPKKPCHALVQGQVETVEGTLETPARDAREVEGRVALVDRFGAWVRPGGERVVWWRMVLCEVAIVATMFGLLSSGMVLASNTSLSAKAAFGLSYSIASLGVSAWCAFYWRALFGVWMWEKNGNRFAFAVFIFNVLLGIAMVMHPGE